MISLSDLNGQGVSVHTGFPNPAIDTSLRGLDLNQLLVSNPVSTFLMHVSGDDWQEIGVFAGDVAIIDRALSVKPTDIVVWHNGGDFAISNQAKIPKEAVTWGVVTAIIHQYRSKADPCG